MLDAHRYTQHRLGRELPEGVLFDSYTEHYVVRMMKADVVHRKTFMTLQEAKDYLKAL